MHIMIHIHTFLYDLTRDKSGAVATEYAFLIAFIAIVGAGGMVVLGNNLFDFFEAIGLSLSEYKTELPTPGS